MSFATPECPDCHRPTRFERVGPFGEDEQTFGVLWRCPQCTQTSLDVCPIGPLLPKDGDCLNCGADVEPETACGHCGLLPDEVPAEPFTSYPEEDVGAGLIRLALLRANATVARDVSSREAWRLKVEMLLGLGYLESLTEMLRAGVDAGGPRTLLVSLGCACYDRQRYEDALRAYDDYLEEPDPKLVTAVRANKANALSMLGDTEQADALYLQAIEAEPSRASHYSNRVLLLLQERRHDEAMECLDAAFERAELGGLEGELHEHRAYLHCERDDGEAALGPVREALRLRPESVRAVYLEGRALALVGELGEADRRMQRVLELDPDNADAVRARKMLTKLGKPWWKFW